MTVAERLRALHPRVSVGNDTPIWFRPRRTVWGVTLDGKYYGAPRCRSIEGALKKAEALSFELRTDESIAKEQQA